MIKVVTALTAALVAGWVVAGSATSASAHYRGPSSPRCHACGPLPTTVHVNTVHTSKSYTRYHDESVYRHVPRYHRIVTVTRIQPVVHILNVTRIHHRTVYFVKDTYAHRTEHLPPLTYERSAVVNIYHKGCGCY